MNRLPPIPLALLFPVIVAGCASDDAGTDAQTEGSSASTSSAETTSGPGSASTTAGSGESTTGDPTASSTSAGSTDGTDTDTGGDPSCELDDSCVDDTPSTCGDGSCDATDHCDTCPDDCGACTGAPPTVVRGPYLQRAAPDQMVVMWRTSSPTDSAVAYGPSPDDLRWVTQDGAATTDHEVVIEGLHPATRYHYGFGTTDGPLLGKTEDHHFKTFPTAGVDRPTRLWMIGDSGRTGSAQQAVRDAYLEFAADRPADLWLMLGDNAYDDGTDDEYQDAVFAGTAYADLVRNQVIWPTIGNHERVADNGDDAAYFSIFSVPTTAQAGGVASATEYYYAFDYGQVHVVCLDSDTNSDSSAAMAWLRSDLEANDKRWLIAFWHHPPYTNGSHNSDDEGTLGEMRENFLPILEEFGVDMVFTGHSHSYERSMMLYGHYGSSDELAGAPKLKLDDGDGDPEGDGAYTKVAGASCPDLGTPLAAGASCGTIYSVVGSSSLVSESDNPTRYDGGPLLPSMVRYLETLGSVVVDIDGDTADVVFLDSGDDGDPAPTYSITDRYRLVK